MEASVSTFGATEPLQYATPSILSYWYVFLVLLVVLAISMVFFCTCLVKRKRRHGQQSLAGTDTPIEQRNMALHSIKPSAQHSSSSVLEYRGNASPGSISIGHTPIPSPQPSFSSSHRSGQSGSRYSSSLAGGQKRRRRNHSPAHTSSGSEDTIRGVQGHSLSSLTSSVATLEPQCSRLHRAESTSSGHTSRATLSRCGSRTFSHRRSTSNPSVKITALTPESPLHSTPSLLSVESGHTHKSTHSTKRRSSIDSSNRVLIDVKVHLDQSQEMAPSQIAAALAESARQLAQSAANFEQDDDDRSTWSRSNMSSPKPSLSVLSAPHVPYQGKSRRQLFANNSTMDHQSRQDVLRPHTPLAMTSSVHAASMDKLPHAAISLERSGQTVCLDRPANTINLDRPTHTISLDRPAHAISLDRPTHAVSLDRPTHAISLDKPTHAISLDRPTHAVSLDRPAHAVSLDRPTHTISLDRPTHAVSLDRPDRLGHVSLDRPGHVSLDRPGHVSLDRPGHVTRHVSLNRPGHVSSDRSDHRISLERSSHIVTNIPAHAVGPGQAGHMLQVSHVNPPGSDRPLYAFSQLDPERSQQQLAGFASAEHQQMVAEPKYNNNIHVHSGQPTMWTSHSNGFSATQSATNTVTNQQNRLLIPHSGHSVLNPTLEQSVQHQGGNPSSTNVESAVGTESEVSTLKASSHQGTAPNSQDLPHEVSLCPSTSSSERHGEVDRCVASPSSSNDESSLHSRSGSGLSLEPTLGSAVSGYAATGSSSSTETISRSLQNYDNSVTPPAHLLSDNATGQPHLVRTNHRMTSMDSSGDHAPHATSMNSVRSGNVYYTTDAIPVHTRKPPAVNPLASTRMEAYSVYATHNPALYEPPYSIPGDTDATAMNPAYPWTVQSRFGYAMHGPGGIVAPNVAVPQSMMPPSRVVLDYGSEVGIHGPSDIAPPHPHDSITNLHEDIPSGSMTIDI